MKPRLIFMLLITALLLVSIPAAQAAPQAYNLPWWKVAAGGGDSQGGSYLLQGTAGQSEAGTLNGGQYILEGGFWSPSQAGGHETFLPFLTRSN
jgi:hypothetical protein